MRSLTQIAVRPLRVKVNTTVTEERPMVGTSSDDENENATNLHSEGKTVLHAQHVRFSFWYISMSSSPRQRDEMIKFSVDKESNRQFVFSSLS